MIALTPYERNHTGVLHDDTNLGKQHADLIVGVVVHVTTNARIGSNVHMQLCRLAANLKINQCIQIPR